MRFQIGNQPPQVATPRLAIPAGAVITTGEGASVVLAFADGQKIVLGARTRFRIVDYRFLPKELDKSGVLLNLIEGSVRLVMGAIGEYDPRLIRIQVGTGTLAGTQSPDGGRGGDAAVSVQGAVTLLAVSQGQVSLTLPSGQSFQVAAGQGLLVRADGTVQQGSAGQISALASQSGDGKLVVEQLGQLQSFVFPPGGQLTIITSAEPPLVLDLPPIGTTSLGTPSTGAGGGGLPCGASCN